MVDAGLKFQGNRVDDIGRVLTMSDESDPSDRIYPPDQRPHAHGNSESDGATPLVVQHEGVDVESAPATHAWNSEGDSIDTAQIQALPSHSASETLPTNS